MTERHETLPDDELLKLSMSGNEEAFLFLYQRLKTGLFRYAFYMKGSQTSAEEVVQEVFVSLLKNGDRYQPAQGDLAGFVFGIARNLIRRLKKREGRTEELPDNEVLQRSSLQQPAANDLSAHLIRQEGIEKIRSAIASLPDHYRQVIVLCDLCEVTYTEAASRLQCAVGTVRSRLNRAHALLAQKLKQARKRQPELGTSGREECLT
jgi:RNA polymerase sigma-70 factor, ECF subfamily